MSVKRPANGFLAREQRYSEKQTTTLLKLMELLGPGGVLERFSYGKLPRIAQYEVIKEVLWAAFKETWNQDESILGDRLVRHDYRKTMKFAIKNLMDHLGLTEEFTEQSLEYQNFFKKNRRKRPICAGFGCLRLGGLEQVRHSVDIILPAIQEEPSQTSSFRKMPKTSIFFQPSKKLAHLHAKHDRDDKLERIRIAAGLTSKNMGKEKKKVHQSSKYLAKIPKKQIQGLELPPIGYAYNPDDGWYRSSHFSVFDPMGGLHPVDMNLQANLGRPEFSPEISYRAAAIPNIRNKQQQRVQSKLEKMKYQSMSTEDKIMYKKQKEMERLKKQQQGKYVSSETDLSEDLSDHASDEELEYEVASRKQHERAKRNMLKTEDTDESVADSNESDYWKEKPGALPKDMRKHIGRAQLLLPGFDLQTIGVPKNEVEKETMLTMYDEVIDDVLNGLTTLEDLESEDDEDREIIKQIMEAKQAGPVNLEELVASSGLSEEQKVKRLKKMKLNQQLINMAETMGDGTDIKDIRRNMKNIISDDASFQAEETVTMLNAKKLIDQTARSIISQHKVRRSLGDDLAEAADIFDENVDRKNVSEGGPLSDAGRVLPQEKNLKHFSRTDSASRTRRKTNKTKETRRRKGEIVSSDSSCDDEYGQKDYIPQDYAGQDSQTMKTAKKKAEKAAKRAAKKGAKREGQNILIEKASKTGDVNNNEIRKPKKSKKEKLKKSIQFSRNDTKKDKNTKNKKDRHKNKPGNDSSKSSAFTESESTDVSMDDDETSESDESSAMGDSDDSFEDDTAVDETSNSEVQIDGQGDSSTNRKKKKEKNISRTKGAGKKSRKSNDALNSGDTSDKEQNQETVYFADSDNQEGHIEKRKKKVQKTKRKAKQKNKSKGRYSSSEEHTYNAGNALSTHTADDEALEMNMDANMTTTDESKNSPDYISKTMDSSSSNLDIDRESINKAETQRAISQMSRRHTESSLTFRPPWRAGIPPSESAMSKASTYADEFGIRAASRKSRERNTSKRGPREPTYTIPDLKSTKASTEESAEINTEFDWNQFDLPKPKTTLEIEEEIKELELTGNYDASANLRQVLRDKKRSDESNALSRKAQIEAKKEAARLAKIKNMNVRKEQREDLKGKVQRERRREQLKADKLASERKVALAACETEEEREILAQIWEAERIAEEEEGRRLAALAREQRKIQLEMLKRQFKLRKKLQLWRDIQLDHFGFGRSHGINRPFIYSHIPGPIPISRSQIIS